jgi:hypothetical protein
MGNIAVTRNQGKWIEAEQLQVQVMDMRKKLLGAEHPFTLTSMADIAFSCAMFTMCKVHGEMCVVKIIQKKKRRNI